LRPESIQELDRVAQILKANPGVNISVEGHCDSRNTDEYNMTLGDNRSTAAYKYLLRKGISDARLVTASYGERRPAAPNDTPENMQLNRRVEFRVIQREGEPAPALNTGNSSTSTGSGVAPTTTTATTTSSAAPMGTALPDGKAKVKMADGTMVKTKVDDEKVKIKTEAPNGEESKTKAKNGEIDSKVKDASGKTKVKTTN
jgi:hypothetical protein